MNKKLLSGAGVLLLGGMICKILGAFYRIPLSNILGAEGIGLYQLVFPVFSLFLIVTSSGVSIALSRQVALCRANGQGRRAKRFLWQAFFVLAALSSMFSVLFFVFAGKIAAFQGAASSEKAYFIVGGIIIFASVLTAFRGYFQGYEKMAPTAISQILEQLGKLTLGLLFSFIFMQRGLVFGVVGAFIGILLSEAISFVYLLVSYLKSAKFDILESEATLPNFWSDFKLLLLGALPITLNATILPLILAVDSFLIVNLLNASGHNNSSSLFGIYSGMINSLINFPTVISLALAVSIIPNISYLKTINKNFSDEITVIIKTCLFVSIPCVLGYLFFAKPVIDLLYPSLTTAYQQNVAVTLLKISSFNVLLISLIQVSTAIFQADGKSYFPLLTLAGAGGVKILLTVFLVSGWIGIYGAAIANLACYFIAATADICGVVFLYKPKISTECAFNLAISSSVMLFVLFGSFYLFSLMFSTNFASALAIFAAIIIYIFNFFALPIFSDYEYDYLPKGEKLKIMKAKLSPKFRNK